MATSPRGSSRWRDRLLIVAALYFTFLGGTFVTDLDFWPRVAHHVVVSAILGGWVLSLWRRKSTIPATPLDLPMVGVVGSWVVATVLAVDPRVSIEVLWQLCVCAAFFYILVDMMRSWGPVAVLTPIFFAAAVVVIVGLFEYASWYFGLGWLPMFRQGWPAIGGLADPIPPTLYRLTFTLNVSTFLAGYLSLLIPVALAWAISTTSRDIRQGLFMWIAGAAIVLVLSFSRGGLLSLGVGMLVFATLLLMASPTWRERGLRAVRDWRFWAVTVPVIAVAGVILAPTVFGSSFGHASGDRMRFDLFQSAWKIGLSHPITGVGPYGFGRAVREFRDPTVTHDSFTSSHSVPLQTFAETGLLGVVALAWLLISGGLMAWRRWRSATGQEQVRVAGVIAALAGFAAQNMADTLINLPVLIPWMALGAYLVMPLKPEAERIGSGIRRGILTAVSAMIVVSIVGWVLSDLAQYHFHRSIQAAQKIDYDTALHEIDAAVAIDPAHGYYAAQRAQVLGVLASVDPTYLPRALDAYDRALQNENSYALIRANHALVLRESGEIDAALSEAEAAVVFQPDNAVYHIILAELYEEKEDDPAGLSTYQMALKLKPDWVTSGFWDKTELRQQARDSIVKSLGGEWTVEQLGMLDTICWAAGPDTDTTSMAVDPYCHAQITLNILHKPADALPWLDQAIAANRANGSAYVLRAEAYRRQGDAARAEKDARTALFLGASHANLVLGRLAEDAGRDADAERFYRGDPPLLIQSQGWDVAVFQRRGFISPLPLLDAPGPSRYDFEAWYALLDLLERQGRTADAASLEDAIHRLDPYAVVP